MPYQQRNCPFSFTEHKHPFLFCLTEIWLPSCHQYAQSVALSLLPGSLKKKKNNSQHLNIFIHQQLQCYNKQHENNLKLFHLLWWKCHLSRWLKDTDHFCYWTGSNWPALSALHKHAYIGLFLNSRSRQNWKMKKTFKYA